MLYNNSTTIVEPLYSYSSLCCDRKTLLLITFLLAYLAFALIDSKYFLELLMAYLQQDTFHLLLLQIWTNLITTND